MCKSEELLMYRKFVWKRYIVFGKLKLKASTSKCTKVKLLIKFYKFTSILVFFLVQSLILCWNSFVKCNIAEYGYHAS